MTASHIRSSIQNIVDFLMEMDIAIAANPIVIATHSGNQRVTWSSPYPQPDNLFRGRFASISSYRDWVNAGAYSVVLFDGSLLQLSVDWDGSKVVGHRFAYIPFPVYVENLEELKVFGIVDVLDSYITDTGDHIRLRSPLRFDYDLSAAVPIRHPSSHLTINSNSCRWPVVGPLSVGHFIRFIFMHFYHVRWNEHGFLRECPLEHGARSLHPEEEKSMLFVAYSRPEPQRLGPQQRDGSGRRRAR